MEHITRNNEHRYREFISFIRKKPVGRYSPTGLILLRFFEKKLGSSFAYFSWGKSRCEVDIMAQKVYNLIRTIRTMRTIRMKKSEGDSRCIYRNIPNT